jgi:hypothetical protein
MNVQSKSLFSRTSTKILLAVVIAVGMLAVLSGVLFNLDSKIAVQSRTGEVVREEYAPLPEYIFIQTHNRSDISGVKIVQIHFPEGLQTLPIFGYIEVHSRPGVETFGAGLPRGLQALPEAGYIKMHSDD